MPVNDINAWADNLEDVRLPAIEADVDNLQTDQLATAALLSAKSQEIGDALNAHTIQIAAAQTDATTAIADAAAVSTEVYGVGLSATAYTNQKVQELRDEFEGGLSVINAYLTGDLQTFITNEVNAILPTLTAQTDQAVADAEAARDALDQELTDVTAVTDQIVDVELPTIHQNQTDFETGLTGVQTDFQAQFTDYPYVNVLDGLNNVQSIIAGQIAPLGYTVPKLPISNWTDKSSTAIFSPKTPPPLSWFVTDDLVFVDAAHLTAGANVTFGQSYPINFNKNKVYRVTVELRVIDDGTQGGVRIALGGSTWEGDAILDQNTEKDVSSAYVTEADGSVTFSYYFSSDQIAMQNAGYSVGLTPTDNAIHLEGLGDPTKAFFHVRQNVDGDTDGQIAIGSFKVEDDSAMTAESTLRQDAIATIDGKLAAGIMMRVKAGTANAQLELIAASDPEGDVSLARISADNIILDGSVQVSHLQADVLSADNIITGQMSSQRIFVDELLSIDAVSGGFSMGKVASNDTDNDGIYMGRTLEADGSTGFGFAMSKTDISGLKQSLRASEAEGLKISNAQFFRELSVPNTFTTYDADTNFDITPGTKTIDLEMIGGGGGGGAGSNGNLFGNYGGNNGSPTTVTLLDGTTVISQWVANGGAGAPNGFLYSARGQNGYGSPYGSGGTGGRALINSIPPVTATTGSAGNGRGSGGGGGGDAWPNNYRCGKGGRSGQFREFANIDVSALADPKIQISIGSGGSGGSGGSRNGGSGRAGRAKIKEISTTPTLADVIPLTPTFTGTVSNGATFTFPDLGGGMWVLNSAGSDLNIGVVEVDDNGSQIRLVSGGCATFISNKTPVYVSGGSSSSDINYLFYKMGT